MDGACNRSNLRFMEKTYLSNSGRPNADDDDNESVEKSLTLRTQKLFNVETASHVKDHI